MLVMLVIQRRLVIIFELGSIKLQLTRPKLSVASVYTGRTLPVYTAYTVVDPV